MSAKGTKQLKERHQTILNDLLREEANRYCADCRAKGPRWASWNLGVFLCIRCAGIHRNLGVHISRVKSVNLDSWTPEQIESIKKWGNGRCADYYECYLPEDFIRPHGDSAMETLIRNKYERKLYIKKDGEPPLRKGVQAAVKPSMEEKKEKPKETRQKPTQTKRAETKVERKAARPPKPAAERQPTTVAAAPKPQVSPVIDLLGMDNPSPVPAQQPQQPAPIQNGNNDFDLFMQSTPASSAPQSQAGPASQNPINAFGESTPANSNGESLMLEDKTPAPANTKASIMSLYQSGSQQQKPIYGVPGGLYVTQQQGPNTQMVSGLGQKQPMMQMGHTSMQMGQPSMQMGQPSMRMTRPSMQMGQSSMQMGQSSMQMGQSSMQMGQSSMQMGQPSMQMGNPSMQMGQPQIGMNQQHMMMNRQNFGTSQLNMGVAQPNMGMQQPNMGMSQNQNMMSNMMMMQNQMQNLNMGPRAQMSGMSAPRNQFMAGNFQASLGQSIMANSYGGNRHMMPAQQPILVNGPGAGLAGANMNTSPAMGHTLSNQLWK